jgi:hypothetical protein
MTERSQAPRRPAMPRPPRSRRRRVVAISVAASWLVLLAMTGSIVTATLVLAVLAGIGVLGVTGLRALGVTREHPWAQQLAARPWRDGQDVLRLALRHLPEVFVITPSGSLLAPNAIELQLNPADLHSLCERMELGLISASAAEVYDEQVAAHNARFAGPGPAEVHVLASPSVPPGRFRLRQGQPVNVGAGPGWPSADPSPDGRELAYAAQPAYAVQPAYAAQPAAAGQPAYAEYRSAYNGPDYPDFTAHDGRTRAEPEPGQADPGEPTAIEQRHRATPTLRLVTGDTAAETTVSGARAGRGAVELELPQVPTVSREHARFVYASGQWWITNLGRNGLSINGVPLAGERPLSTGDVIRWGSRPASLQSYVEIS